MNSNPNLHNESRSRALRPGSWTAGQLKRLSFAILALIVLSSNATGAASATKHAEWIVATNGRDSGTGTVGKPLSLARAIGDGFASPVAPGDTILLRGGTYYGGFTSRLAGAADRPIMVMPYGLERPIIEATAINITCLDVYGANVWFYGLECWNSAPDRTSSRNPGIMVFALGTKLIHCIVHDVGSGIGCWDDATPSEIYGCVIYNNGYQVPGAAGRGHGIYAHSKGGSQTIRDNLVGNGFGFNFHFYADLPEHSLDGFTMEGNAAFQGGSLNSPAGGIPEPNYLIGGSTRPASNVRFIGNYGYFSGGYQDNLQLGFMTYENANALVLSNYLVGGTSTINHWTNLILTANTFASISTFWSYNPSSSVESCTWDMNFYQCKFNPWRLSGVDKTWESWKTDTGFDTHSTYSIAAPIGTKVFIRRSAYAPGRANIIIYNWDLSDNVAVDLSGVLTPGRTYTVKNAQDYFGAAVATGTYGGGLVSLPMTNLTVAVPVGATAPVVTGPAFNAFVVIQR